MRAGYIRFFLGVSITDRCFYSIPGVQIIEYLIFRKKNAVFIIAHKQKGLWITRGQKNLGWRRGGSNP